MMPHHWRPLAHEKNSILKCKQHTCTLHVVRATFYSRHTGTLSQDQRKYAACGGAWKFLELSIGGNANSFTCRCVQTPYIYRTNIKLWTKNSLWNEIFSHFPHYFVLIINSVLKTLQGMPFTHSNLEVLPVDIKLLIYLMLKICTNICVYGNELLLLLSISA